MAREFITINDTARVTKYKQEKIEIISLLDDSDNEDDIIPIEDDSTDNQSSKNDAPATAKRNRVECDIGTESYSLQILKQRKNIRGNIEYLTVMKGNSVWTDESALLSKSGFFPVCNSNVGT